MHYYSLIQIGSGDNIDEMVADRMRPHRESDDTPEGFWDWYQIGGRWTGFLSGYDPETDPRNLRPALFGKGVEPKWPTDWARHDGDVTTRGEVPDEKMPYTLVTETGAYSKKTWNGDNFIDTSTDLERVWRSLPADTRLVVVDYHC